jgi:anti-sigma factor RsiW
MKATMCDEMPEMISRYLDDELDEVARTRVRRHAVACAMCGPLFVELQAVDSLFKNAPMMSAPEGFTERTVNAAFQSSFQENLRVGLMTLLLSTAVLLGFLLFANMATLSAWFSPDGLNGAELWIPQMIETLQVFGRVMFGALLTLGEVLAAPLAVMSIGGLVSAYLLVEVLKRTRVQMTA